MNWRDEREERARDYYDWAYDEAQSRRHREECAGCEECSEPPEPCGWCGEADCTDPDCAELTADLEALRAARTPVCLGCAVRVGGVYMSSTYRMARPGEPCAHAGHSERRAA